VEPNEAEKYSCRERGEGGNNENTPSPYIRSNKKEDMEISFLGTKKDLEEDTMSRILEGQGGWLKKKDSKDYLRTVRA